MTKNAVPFDMEDKIRKVGEQFLLKGELDSYGLITRGNINTTFWVKYDNPEKFYIFQKVNTYVFREPRQIMRNIDYGDAFFTIKLFHNLYYGFSSDRIEHCC